IPAFPPPSRAMPGSTGKGACLLARYQAMATQKPGVMRPTRHRVFSQENCPARSNQGRRRQEINRNSIGIRWGRKNLRGRATGRSPIWRLDGTDGRPIALDPVFAGPATEVTWMELATQYQYVGLMKGEGIHAQNAESGAAVEMLCLDL